MPKGKQPIGAGFGQARTAQTRKAAPRPSVGPSIGIPATPARKPMDAQVGQAQPQARRVGADGVAGVGVRRGPSAVRPAIAEHGVAAARKPFTNQAGKARKK